MRQPRRHQRRQGFDLQGQVARHIIIIMMVVVWTMMIRLVMLVHASPPIDAAWPALLAESIGFAARPGKVDTPTSGDDFPYHFRLQSRRLDYFWCVLLAYAPR